MSSTMSVIWFGICVALLVIWIGKIEMSSANTFLRAAFILPIALIYGLRLVRGPTTVARG
jgi:hypothetical protein